MEIKDRQVSFVGVSQELIYTEGESLSQAVYYEPGPIVAEGDFVAIHSRIRGWAGKPQVVIDLFRIEGGKLAEHWDVLQNEAPVTAALGGTSMFDPECQYCRLAGMHRGQAREIRARQHRLAGNVAVIAGELRPKSGFQVQILAKPNIRG